VVLGRIRGLLVVDQNVESGNEKWKCKWKWKWEVKLEFELIGTHARQLAAIWIRR